jgi:hypothetical protein
MYDASEDLQHERPDTAKKVLLKKRKTTNEATKKNQKTRL